MTAFDSIAQAVAKTGCTRVFGVPGGGPNLDLIGAFNRHGVEFVLAHTETGAAIMAATFSVVTDTVSAVIVTRGPGAAAAVNGAAHATLDRASRCIGVSLDLFCWNSSKREFCFS